MIPVPGTKNAIVDLGKELIEQCRVSVGDRSVRRPEIAA
jgi:hypothetical protein